MVLEIKSLTSVQISLTPIGINYDFPSEIEVYVIGSFIFIHLFNKSSSYHNFCIVQFHIGHFLALVFDILLDLCLYINSCLKQLPSERGLINEKN